MTKEQELQKALQIAQDALTAYQSGPQPPEVWIPDSREKYYSVAQSGYHVNFANENKRTDRALAIRGNCYQTEELSRKAAEYMRVHGLILQASLNVEGDFEHQLRDTTEWKWSPGYNSEDCRWMPIFSQMVYHGEPVQSTKFKCQQVCDILDHIKLRPAEFYNGRPTEPFTGTMSVR